MKISVRNRPQENVLKPGTVLHLDSITPHAGRTIKMDGFGIFSRKHEGWSFDQYSARTRPSNVKG